MKNRVREIWLEYRSEGLFGLVLGLSLFYMCLTDNPARAFTQQWLLLLSIGWARLKPLSKLKM